MSVAAIQQRNIDERASTPRLRRAACRILTCFVLAAVLAAPGAARARRAALGTAGMAGATLQEQESAQDKEQEKRDREQEARDREQEKRDREQEARDREQEKRDREQERQERLSELYDEGRGALDEDRYDRAEAKFDELARTAGSQTDAALYWKAYAQNRLGKRDAALKTLAELKQRFPQSRWQRDAAALEIDVRQRTGQPPRPEAESDEELKMLAIQGLMNSDPERALPLLEKVLNGTATPREKSKALFVIAQSGSPQAQTILVRVAKGQSNPDLQRKAIEYLGIFGGVHGGVRGGVRGGVDGGVGVQSTGGALQEIYAASTDESVKRAILRSYMIAGDKDDLFAAAKGEKQEQLRREAIRQLGLVHGIDELQQLYQKESSTDVKREILQAFFLAGDSERLVAAANSEKDAELRRAAVRNLGLINSGDSAKALRTIYGKETDRGVRGEVLNAYFIQGNAKGLVEIARGEKDPELKKEAVSKLSLMGNNKEATEYLMEILQK
jgi:tetratricopeptide repeat protein